MAKPKLLDDVLAERVKAYMAENPRATRNQIWRAMEISDRRLALLGEAGLVQLPRKLSPSEAARLARKTSHWGKTYG